jgi:hypothetical protein
VGGVIDEIGRPERDVLTLSCFQPGSRSAGFTIRVRVGKTSVLLRADTDGRMTPLGLEDLEKNKSASMRAVISRERDSSANHLVYWLVLYPDRRAAPPLDDAAADTELVIPQ